MSKQKRSGGAALKVKARFFAGYRDAVGKSEMEIDVEDGATVATIMNMLEGEHPNLSAYTGYLMTAVNSQYVERTHTLKEGDEVAFVPPVSGGV